MWTVYCLTTVNHYMLSGYLFEVFLLNYFFPSVIDLDIPDGAGHASGRHLR